MSAEAKHTPGPWGVWLHSAFDYIIVVGPSEFHTVADVRAGNDEDELPNQTEANAHLIAAAPDLLAALELVMSWIDNWSPHFIDEYAWGADSAKIRAVIAKAKGGQS